MIAIIKKYCDKKDYNKKDEFSSNVNEVIRAVLNFFLQKDFTRTKSTKCTRTQPSKSTKSTKSTKGTKTPQSKSTKRTKKHKKAQKVQKRK